MNEPPNANGARTQELRGADRAHLTDAHRAIIELLRYWRVLRARWLWIAGPTIAVMLVVGLHTKFAATKYYRAETVVTPVPPSQSLASTTGMGALEGIGGGVMSMFGFYGESDNTVIAHRYLAIMRSFSFTTELAKRYQLEPHIARTNGILPSGLGPWDVHRALSDSFDAQYDYKTGNLTLYYFDPDPAHARQMLGRYLDSLREKVRSEEIASATSAASSLQEEIGKTRDALLQNQLYELLARHVQRAKLAQVQADFAFKMVEPPLVPEKPHRPSARESALLAGFVVFVGLCATVLGVDMVRRARAHLGAVEHAAVDLKSGAGDWTVGEHGEAAEAADPARPKTLTH